MENQLQLPGLEVEPETKDDWDFADADTQYGTHGMFPYPARMIPQIADRLITSYLESDSPQNVRVADPFCGSGTVLVEASLKGMPSVGSDLNPFALLLARVKATPVDLDALACHKEQVRQQLQEFDDSILEDYLPQFQNLDHWFKRKVTAQLTWIRRAIFKLHPIESLLDEECLPTQRVLALALANSIMRCSNVNWKSSRYIRTMSAAKLEQHNPDAFLHFRGALMDAQRRLVWYSKRVLAVPAIAKADARRLALDDESIDLVVTSPPYGEERNTIPYIRWSKLFLAWLGLSDKEIAKTQSETLGSDRTAMPSPGEIPSPTFWSCVQGVEERRLREASPFLRDYRLALKQMERVTKRRGRICIVIGDRSISRRLLDMGAVTAEFAASVGLEHEVSYRRRIPKKMIAWTGPTGETISKESIVVLRKL